MLAVGPAGLRAGEPAPTAPAPLRWAADAEGGAPYIFKDPDAPDRYIGFEVDIKNLLEHELGQPISFVQCAFDSLVPALQRGDCDFAMNGIEATPDRKAALRLTLPYYRYALQLVARPDDKRFTSLDDCKAAGLVVGTLGATAAEQLLDQQGVQKKVYSDQVSPYKDLQLGRIDAVLLDLPIAAYFAKPFGLKFVGQPFGKGDYAIAFRKDQEALAARCDAALKRLLRDGRLRQVYEKWHIWTDDQNALLAELVPGSDEAARAGKKYAFLGYFPELLKGAAMTVAITFSSMALAIMLGLPIALLRLYGPAPARWAATAYVEFFRGIPVLLLLFFLYFGLPDAIHLTLAAWQAAVLGFGLNYAAYEAEIYRAAIRGIPVGQWEAAASLGMSRLLSFRRIILPQAIRGILPPMTNDLVALFKDTSIVSIIALNDLTKQYQTLSKQSLQYVEIGLVTAALYLLMSVPLGFLSRYLEKRWGKGA